eukprot:TRINITY_DN6790_c0_g2_i2.p1 TRINITY_DN6790_c0_g2~~TRINITY_DN6790_c0_g2_i2.p1  ORF type:complete len:722 (+),score=145.40 TRINITY_DN6790_c0_g2_i2:45-2168(+)
MTTLKFYPFQSAVEPGFWHTLAKSKLEEFKLSEEAREIRGSLTITHSSQAIPGPRLNITWNALNTKSQESSSSWTEVDVGGSMLLLNTIEAFKQLDKSQWIQQQAHQIWTRIHNDEFWTDPSVLSTFSVIIYGDLKKFQFYYWFNFPSFSVPSSIKVISTSKLSDSLTCDIIENLSSEAVTFRKNDANKGTMFTVAELKDSKWTFHALSHAQKVDSSAKNYICLFDPCSSTDYPSWPLRNLVIALAAKRPDILNSLEVLCLKIVIKDGRYDVGDSLVMKLECSSEGAELDTKSMPNAVGWEKNEKGQLGPRFVNMRSSMDPVKIAESSVDLNLKLMKWRLVPDIDLDIVANAKFLLLGAGTLGCGVARSLLGWGARNITFLDNAKVSYSNPVRQSLYEFQDCLQGGKKKSGAAAQKLRDIFPGVTSASHDMTIPMPGHPIAKSLEAEARSAYDTLEALIDASDVIFLLMDSRESRWLPTVMAAARPDKILINAALGFDTFLVMRHGIRPLNKDGATTSAPPPSYNAEFLPGKNLGCYYCNDVVAPGDSLSDRTLDMQCTVTRPGVSAIAAALAVELAVTCLQHPDRGGAPCCTNSGGGNKSSDTADVSTATESVLGLVPHSIRGSIHTYTQYLPATPAFPQCTACSPSVLQAYASQGFELVKLVGENPKYLEDLTGLTNLLSDSNLMEGVIDIGDDDEFSVTSASDM